MIRDIFKKKLQKLHTSSESIKVFIHKYKVPRVYLSTNRKSVANAIMIGIFIAMIPMPFQMIAVLLFIPFFKFHVPLAIVMVWISNPVTMPFIYYIEYLTGNALLFMDGVSDVELSVAWFSENIDDIFIPLYFGAIFYSSLFAMLSYFGVHHFWKRSVRKNMKNRFINLLHINSKKRKK